MTNPKLEDCAAETDGYKIFQLYVRGDMDWVEKTLDRVVNAGFDALAITVDVAHYGRRERDLYNRFNRRAFAQRANLEGINLDEEWRWRGALTWDSAVNDPATRGGDALRIGSAWRGRWPTTKSCICGC